MLDILPTRLLGLILIQPRVFGDARGFFLESFNLERYAEVGIDGDFVQDNHSRSGYGTLRGLHFQVHPGQPKLVRCARGSVYDVVVDVRRSSPTFGEWEAFELDDSLHHQLYIPVGFAHGLCATSDAVDFVYKVGSYYNPAEETGIAWNDPDLGIPWPVDNPVLSERDRTNPPLAEITSSLPDW